MMQGLTRNTRVILATKPRTETQRRLNMAPVKMQTSAQTQVDYNQTGYNRPAWSMTPSLYFNRKTPPKRRVFFAARGSLRPLESRLSQLRLPYLPLHLPTNEIGVCLTRQGGCGNCGLHNTLRTATPVFYCS